MTQLGFAFNADECIGCKVCVAACKDVHSLPVGFKLRKVVTGEAGSWELDNTSGLVQPRDVFSYSISYSCMHCANPACMAKCPKHAISKDARTGIVSIDERLCVGCGACAKACPWSAPVVVPRIDGTRVSRKCDLCHDALAAGEEPACVAACLMRCLKVVEFADSPDDGPKPIDVPMGYEHAKICADPLLASAPQAGPHFAVVPHRGLVAHPDAAVRIHSMPEEYENG
jgi:anaerobic dimethyl sulfoxide reductase subunit B (iron-sulfur subunit)